MVEFWCREQLWPRDTEDHIFLARAVHTIGRAMFNDAWTGSEPADHEQLQGKTRNADLLKQATPQFTKVKNEIRDRVASGTLIWVWRPVDGGKMSPPLAADLWNTEKIEARFMMCQMNPDEPFSSGFAGDGFGWIYLTRESLEAFLLSQPFALLPPQFDLPLSPYMRLMIALILRLKISPENQPKIAELEAHLRSSWTGSIRLSDNLVHAMATLMREPESQLGKAAPRREPRRSAKKKR